MPSDTAGLPIFPAIVRYDEVERGMVAHALRFAVRRTRAEYIYPARHVASRDRNTCAPAMGQRFRLQATVNPPRPFQAGAGGSAGFEKYGMIVADKGSAWFISSSSDPRIQELDGLQQLKGSDFEVVVTTPETGAAGRYHHRCSPALAGNRRLSADRPLKPARRKPHALNRAYNPVPRGCARPDAAGHIPSGPFAIESPMIGLLFFIVLCYAAAGMGGWLTRPGLPWLATLKKPAFNPPKWIFGPVWSVLYGLMAFSGWLVFAAPEGAGRTAGLILFAIQLALNTAWSGLFFYLRRPGWALLDIIPLGLTIWWYVIWVWPVSSTAASLFIPYGLWVGFATLLNGSIWWLNRSNPSPAISDQPNRPDA